MWGDFGDVTLGYPSVKPSTLTPHTFNLEPWTLNPGPWTLTL